MRLQDLALASARVAIATEKASEDLEPYSRSGSPSIW
jgi:hypothetical protein